MATDFRDALDQKTPIKTIASIGAANWELVQIPKSTKKISLTCEGHDIYASFSYTDAASASTTDAVYIAQKTMFTQNLPNGIASIAVISKTGTASNVCVILEDTLG